MQLWVILGDLSAISTVVTVPAGIAESLFLVGFYEIFFISDVILAPLCIYSLNTAGI